MRYFGFRSMNLITWSSKPKRTRRKQMIAESVRHLLIEKGFSRRWTLSIQIRVKRCIFFPGFNFALFSIPCLELESRVQITEYFYILVFVCIFNSVISHRRQFYKLDLNQILTGNSEIHLSSFCRILTPFKQLPYIS